VKRYRLHTTGAGDGKAITIDFPYTHWRTAYAVAANYSAQYGHCVVQSDKAIGPRGNKHLETIAVFAYGRKLGASA
jgi:hypothetical protein